MARGLAWPCVLLIYGGSPYFLLASIVTACETLFCILCKYRAWYDCQRSYQREYTGSLSTTEVKRARARLVLSWVTRLD